MFLNCILMLVAGVLLGVGLTNIGWLAMTGDKGERHET